MSTESLTGRRVIFASAFGNALEFLEFTTYNLFILYFTDLFFAGDDAGLKLFFALSVMGVSFVFRPLGAVLIGRYADRCGRKPAMVLTVFLMGIGTAMIGLAPTFAVAGYGGTIVLVLGRIIQGMASGGEVGASTALLVESAPPGQRGFYASWQLATQGLATAVAAVLAIGLAAVLPPLTGNPDVMYEWGWRLPFLIGVVLSPIGLLIRLRLLTRLPPPQERPAAIRLRDYIGRIIIGIVVIVGGIVAVLMTTVYYGVFATIHLGLSKTDSDISMLLAGVLLLVLSPVFGSLSDRIGRKRLVLVSRLAVAVLAPLSFWLLVTVPQPWMLFAVVTVMMTIAAVGATPSQLISAEIFPRHARALCFAVVTALAVIAGGLAPALSERLIVVTGSLLAPSLYLIAASLASLLAFPFFRDVYRDQLEA